MSTRSVASPPAPAVLLGYDAKRRRLVGVTADDKVAWGRAFQSVHVAAELRRFENLPGKRRAEPARRPAAVHSRVVRPIEASVAGARRTADARETD
jgi:hypothetical protein